MLLCSMSAPRAVFPHHLSGEPNPPFALTPDLPCSRQAYEDEEEGEGDADPKQKHVRLARVAPVAFVEGACLLDACTRRCDVCLHLGFGGIQRARARLEAISEPKRVLLEGARHPENLRAEIVVEVTVGARGGSLPCAEDVLGRGNRRRRGCSRRG